MRSRHSCIVNAMVAYDRSKTGQVVNFLINQAIDMKGLNHNLLFPMQCCMNGDLIDAVLMFLAPIPSENMNAIQIENPLMHRVTNYFDMIKQTQKMCEDKKSSR